VEEVAEVSAFNATDMGNGERLAALHGEDLRYVAAWGKWLVWDGRRYRPDDTGAVDRLAKDTVRSIYEEAARADSIKGREDLAKHAVRSEDQRRVDAMKKMARSEPPVAATAGGFDADPMLLNVENGTLDLRTGQLREHRREDLITKLAPVEYDPEAEAPTWEATLSRLLPSDELRGFFRRFVGYCLTGNVSEQVLVFLNGAGSNGKSTIITALREMMGDYGKTAPEDLLTAKRYSSHPTELATLQGARLMAAVETEEGKQLAESRVKQVTGGDKISARRMNEDFWEFWPTHKILLAANHRPEVRGTDHAIWRRIKLVPFDVRLTQEEKDPGRPEKLRAELAGILAWAVRGCREWLSDGLGEPDEVRDATAGYRDEQDVLADFLDERCVVGAGIQALVADLYNSYKDWCERSGEKAETKNRLGRRLSERGFEGARSSKGAHVRLGIGLRGDTFRGPDGGPGRGSDRSGGDATHRGDVIFGATESPKVAQNGASEDFRRGVGDVIYPVCRSEAQNGSHEGIDLHLGSNTSPVSPKPEVEGSPDGGGRGSVGAADPSPVYPAALSDAGEDRAEVSQPASSSGAAGTLAGAKRQAGAAPEGDEEHPPALSEVVPLWRARRPEVIRGLDELFRQSPERVAADPAWIKTALHGRKLVPRGVREGEVEAALLFRAVAKLLEDRPSLLDEGPIKVGGVLWSEDLVGFKPATESVRSAMIKLAAGGKALIGLSNTVGTRSFNEEGTDARTREIMENLGIEL
jgi:P4 family phage/plasmid primase-like protien